MDPETAANGFTIWGLDNEAYGPVELPTLVDWIKDERVQADTWIFSQRDSAWRHAADITELQMFFKPRSTVATARSLSSNTVKPGSLRRVKILAGLTEAQLERFSQFMELQRVTQYSTVVRQGDVGDAMYLILDGELRVRMLVGGKETILSTLGPGDFFGDLSLFDHGPRSADVIANVDSSVLKMTSSAFEKLAREAPEVATPFLMGATRTLAARMRADNKRLRDTVSFGTAGGY